MNTKRFKEEWKKAIAKSDSVYVAGSVYIAGTSRKKLGFLIKADDYQIDSNRGTIDLYFRKKYIGWIDLSLVTNVS